MSFRRTHFGARSTSAGRQSPSRAYASDANLTAATRNDVLPNILPELMKNIRKLLPQELPSNIQVRHVEYSENGYERLIGTLYMTTFRLVFTPDNSTEHHHLISSGNKYIGDCDIPLASIYKINVAPVDARSGFKSFLHDHQIQSETRTFTIITRDFRNITFTKCSVTNSNTNGERHPNIPVTRMETYIDALKVQSQTRNRDQMFVYLVLQQNSINTLSPRARRSQTLSNMAGARLIEDDITDFCLSNDERIKSYMTMNDWADELYEANEQRWSVDQRKFNNEQIVRDEGPYIRLITGNDFDGSTDLIWHWTHTSQVSYNRSSRRQIQVHKYMLITVAGIGDISAASEPSAESPTTLPNVPSSSSFRFFNRKMKIPKSFRSNPTDGPKLISTKEHKTTMSSLLIPASTTPDEGLRRVATETGLTSSSHYVGEQSFLRYNLAKFPCQLKRLQTSFERLMDICVITPDDDDEKWWSKLNACKWLKYISKALHGAASLAKLLNFKNIELAGSDTDNNCLMSSLIQILLRPKCRTIKGFCELIVREWIIRGHKFRERFGQVQYDIHGYPTQESPVFLLFLDCVHQLILQNSFAFEFTEYLLLELYRDVCYCYHHTFAFNNILERLEAIQHCPNNLLVLSSFDFSLYLYPNTYRLLKNDASIFNSNKSTPSQQANTAHVEATVVYPSSERPNRTVYYLEQPTVTNFKLDVPLANGTSLQNPEQYDYDVIESPQHFPADLHVDWRTINLVLWSKCYCRYDQNNAPPLREQQLSFEINCLKEDMEKIHSKSRRQITLDTFHCIGYANSWHPQSLDTRV